jgi:hypothetical protein
VFSYLTLQSSEMVTSVTTGILKPQFGTEFSWGRGWAADTSVYSGELMGYPIPSVWGPVKSDTSLDQLSDSVVWSLLSLRLGYVEMEHLNVANGLLLAMTLLENCTCKVGPN